MQTKPLFVQLKALAKESAAAFAVSCRHVKGFSSGRLGEEGWGMDMKLAGAGRKKRGDSVSLFRKKIIFALLKASLYGRTKTYLSEADTNEA